MLNPRQIYCVGCLLHKGKKESLNICEGYDSSLNDTSDKNANFPSNDLKSKDLRIDCW